MCVHFSKVSSLILHSPQQPRLAVHVCTLFMCLDNIHIPVLKIVAGMLIYYVVQENVQ